MLTLAVDKKRVLQTVIVFNRIMKRYGKSVSFPKNTDPTKTYSWRYFVKFLERYDKLELDDDIMPSVMSAIADYARKHNLLRCGCSMLMKIDLAKICEKKFEQEAEYESKTLEDIERSHNFLCEQLRLERTKDPHLTLEGLLIKRVSRRAYANITRWNGAGQITTRYIAVSKLCRRVLRRLDDHELNLFPTPRQFLKIRLNLTMPGPLLDGLRSILGEDLFED